MNSRRAIFSALVLAVIPIASLAQDFAKGHSAYQRGDFEVALQEWRPLADQGHVDAQYNLSVMYRHGKGVPQDDAEAVRWYQLAAEQGHAGAQENLGFMYSSGNGVPQDYAEALRWYQLAAGQGNASAQTNLGFMYKYSSGVPEDYVSAHMWLNIASVNGGEASGEWRDEIAANLTAEQIEEAQRRAEVCLASNYQDCD
jgi:TPR repeat protein